MNKINTSNNDIDISWMSLEQRLIAAAKTFDSRTNYYEAARLATKYDVNISLLLNYIIYNDFERAQVETVFATLTKEGR